MPFCPVPHTGRDQVWVAVGIATGFAVAKLLGYYGTSASNTPAGVAVGKRVQHEVYSEPDQQLRVATAKKTGNTRFNNIAAVFDGKSLEGKRVVVTGGNRGLGLAIVKELVKQKANVVVVGRTSNDELVALGVQVVTGVDVSDDGACAEMAKTVQAGGPIDIVINNAGYFYGPRESVIDGTMNFDEEVKQINICAVGPLRVTTALFSAGLLKPGSKSVTISSQAGSTEWRSTQNADEGGDYGHHMSRAACNIAAALMSEELRSKGVAIGILHPGFNRTEMTQKYSHIWDIEGAVEPSVGAMRVLHEVQRVSMLTSGDFINCEDGLPIPW